MMIEILDKVNNKYKTVDDTLDKVIHPLNNNVTLLRDVKIKGHYISGVIFEEDGSTLFTYKNNDNKEVKKRI